MLFGWLLSWLLSGPIVGEIVKWGCAVGAIGFLILAGYQKMKK